ncbi:hypothetical protein WJX72_000172 [[Myrmecia] bisecta]|uniref:Uncharacterized protein n=1 Tax=[Myrmecia] bisecta TaxID=41462 RepID=A0AAW1Q366_9CHLO
MARPDANSQAAAEVLETGKLLLAGGVAGAVSKTATAPLARLTILYQVQGMHQAHGKRVSLQQAVTQIIRQEGVRALWKGNMVTIIHRLPYSAVNFWAYERFTELWHQHFPGSTAGHGHGRTDILRRLTAGGAAGMCACTLAYPLDLVRTRLAAQTTSHYYHGIGYSLKLIVKDEGFLGLYRGLGATLIQVAPSLAINYCAYETLRSHWLAMHPERKSPTVAMSLLCGSVAGLVSSTVTFPLDLVRRRMQLEGQGGKQMRYGSYTQVFRSIMRRDGLRGFYSGILPEYYKVIPGVAIAFCSYELMKKVLGVQVGTMRR